MNKESAIKFLLKHQPMPSDLEMTEELIDMYDEVRKFCINNPFEECIPLFLNSFGEINGFGVYQLVEEVLLQFPKDIVLVYVLDALKSNYYSVRYWTVDISLSFIDIKLVEPLLEMYYTENDDMKIAIVSVLSFIKEIDTINLLEEVQENETSEDVKSFIKEIISSI